MQCVAALNVCSFHSTYACRFDERLSASTLIRFRPFWFNSKCNWTISISKWIDSMRARERGIYSRCCCCQFQVCFHSFLNIRLSKTIKQPGISTHKCVYIIPFAAFIATDYRIIDVFLWKWRQKQNERRKKRWKRKSNNNNKTTTSRITERAERRYFYLKRFRHIKDVCRMSNWNGWQYWHRYASAY